MSDSLVVFLSSYGLPGVIIFALFYGLFHMVKLFYKLIQLNQNEREVWLRTFIDSNKISDNRHRETSQIMDVRQKETNEVIRNLTAAFERHNK